MVFARMRARAVIQFVLRAANTSYFFFAAATDTPSILIDTFTIRAQGWLGTLQRAYRAIQPMTAI